MTGNAKSASPNPPSLNSERVLMVIALAATFIAYAATLGFDFVYDDHEQITENFRIQSWQFVPGYFTEHVWSHISPQDPSNFYRPVFLLWLRLNHLLVGLKPAGWHFTTVLLHLAATLLVYRLARRLLEEPLGAFLAALIFGMHPIHVEPVAWVSGATEPLLAVFFVSSFLCYFRWREGAPRRWAWALCSLALYVLAVLTKETALTLPALVLTWEWIFGRQGEPGAKPGSRRQRLANLAVVLTPYAILTALYLAVRLRVLKELGHFFTPLPFRTVALTAPSLLWFYLRHLIWPAGASPFYDVPYVAGLRELDFLFPAAVVLVAGAGLVWWGWRSPAIAFASFWMLLPILPVLDLRVFSPDDFVHDRYLYLPSVGFSIIAAAALCRLSTIRPKSRWFGYPAVPLAAGALLALALGLGTMAQSLFWADDIVLANRGLAAAPRSAIATNLLANAMERGGQRVLAVALYRRAFELKPSFWEPHYSLAVLSYKSGRIDEAERQVSQAIRINPFDPREFVCLGFARLQEGKSEEAAALMRHAVELRPDAPKPHMALGVVLEAQGKLEAALQEFKTAVVLDPGRASAREEVTELETRLRAKPADADKTPVPRPKLDQP